MSKEGLQKVIQQEQKDSLKTQVIMLLLFFFPHALTSVFALDSVVIKYSYCRVTFFQQKIYVISSHFMRM